MASTLPPVKGAAFNFPICLVSQADTDVFKTTVTITAADVWVSKDGGAFAAVTAAPTELQTGAAANTGVLWQNLTATEMTADVVTVLYHDAADSEWQDAVVTIYTAGQALDTIDGNVDAILVDTGTDGVKIAATQGAVTWGQQKISANVAGEGALHLTNSNANGVGLSATGKMIGIKADGSGGGAGYGLLASGSVGGLVGSGQYGIIASGTAADFSPALADAVWNEALSGHETAGTAGAALSLAASESGLGSITFTYTLTDSGDGTPIDNAIVEVYSDSTMSTLVAAGTTDSSGQVVFYLDAGTYYLRRIKTGYSFTNPDSETVA